MNVTIFDTVKRPWGYETLVSVIDDSNRVWNECISSESIIAVEEIETRVIHIVTERLAFIEAEAAQNPETPGGE
jgi:hypothetical protein